MKQMMLKVGVVVVLVGCFSSVALALDPMGAPKAGLNKGQMSIGIEYSYSDHKLKWPGYDNQYTGFTQKISKLFARIGYGISDKTEGFLRLGISDYDYAREGNSGPWKGNDSSAFAMGFGLKTTFAENEKVAWGGLAQLSWANYKGTRTSKGGGSYDKGTFETEVMEFLLAAGPTYKLKNGISVYGGPFLHYLDADHRHVHGGGSRSYGIDRSSFGAYIGTQIYLSQNSNLNLDYMATKDSWALSSGIIWKF